jgi:TRAP-type uncharacterized transport system substrate-binding protein
MEPQSKNATAIPFGKSRIYRPLFILWLGAGALTTIAIWLAFVFLRPTPPYTVTMAIGPDGTYNAELGRRYRDILARDGIDLRLIPLAGDVESVARLNDPKSNISIAIISGGITNRVESPGLVSLGTLFYEPLWFFLRQNIPEKQQNLKGLRIAIGPEGSGSRKLAIEFFAREGLIDQNSATLLPLSPQESAEKLRSGEIDAAVLLDAWESRDVHEFKDAKLANVRRADAFVALYPFLNKLVMPAGLASLVENRPPEDVLILAPKASLVVRGDLHPAIQYLLLEAASQLHSEAGVFHSAAQFPAPESVGLPLSPHARQFYRGGSPFLQRHLPFWLAVLVQQLLLLLIPVLGFIYPLLRFSPLIYGWVYRRRVYKLYVELKKLEDGLASGSPQSAENVMQRLDNLEDRAIRLYLPAAYRPFIYELRMHISIVRQRLPK